MGHARTTVNFSIVSRHAKWEIYRPRGCFVARAKDIEELVTWLTLLEIAGLQGALKVHCRSTLSGVTQPTEL